MIFEVLSEFTNVYTNFSNDRSQTFREPFYRSPSQNPTPRFICLGLEIIKCNSKIVVVNVIYVIDLNVQKIPEN